MVRTEYIVNTLLERGGGKAVTGSLLTAFSQSLLSCVSLCLGIPFFFFSFSPSLSIFSCDFPETTHGLFLYTCACFFFYIYNLISVLFYSLWISLKPTRS